MRHISLSRDAIAARSIGAIAVTALAQEPGNLPSATP